MPKPQLLRLTIVLYASTLLLCAGCSDTDSTGQTLQKNAISSGLKKQCNLWKGTLSIHRANRQTTTFPIAYHIKNNKGIFEGSLDIEKSQTDGDAMKLVVPLAFQENESGQWTGRMGTDRNLSGRAPLDAQGKPDKRVISWSSPQAGFNISLLGETSMDLAFDGLLPLPDGLSEGALWMDARLQREGFRIVLGPFQIAMMECLGFLATLTFASRFIIQWIASERAKKSVVPEVFWWVSIVGSLMMLIYGIYFSRLAIVFGQMTGWTVYSRNLWLIKREKRAERRRLRKLNKTKK